jgi:hypothetical protein
MLPKRRYPHRWPLSHGGECGNSHAKEGKRRRRRRRRGHKERIIQKGIPKPSKRQGDAIHRAKLVTSNRKLG